jgi:hypothetical protein
MVIGHDVTLGVVDDARAQADAGLDHDDRGPDILDQLDVLGLELERGELAVVVLLLLAPVLQAASNPPAITVTAASPTPRPRISSSLDIFCTPLAGSDQSRQTTRVFLLPMILADAEKDAARWWRSGPLPYGVGDSPMCGGANPRIWAAR